MFSIQYDCGHKMTYGYEYLSINNKMGNKIYKKTSFFPLYLAKKNSKNKKFNTVVGHIVAIYVYM